MAFCTENSLLPETSFKDRGHGVHPKDVPRIRSTPPIPSLAVLLAKQVAAHLTEEDVMKFAPLYVHLICNMGINKRKQDKGKG